MFREFSRILTYIYVKIFFLTEFKNLNNIPKTGSLILYAKHSSNLDPVLIIGPITRMVNIMAKEELFKNKLLAKMFISFGAFPIKRGAKDITAVKNSLISLGKGNILCMFPEGTRRKPGKTIQVKPGLAMIAIKAECPVLPVAIIGKPRLFNKIRVIYGKPIDLSQYYDKELTTEDYIKISESLMIETDKLMEG
jgi:1-acyl-sn-glycerol-3-phosphate acyltransferase